jgi:hypothetical protein
MEASVDILLRVLRPSGSPFTFAKHPHHPPLLWVTRY